jgi:hypothetical protein
MAIWSDIGQTSTSENWSRVSTSHPSDPQLGLILSSLPSPVCQFYRPAVSKAALTCGSRRVGTVLNSIAMPESSCCAESVRPRNQWSKEVKHHLLTTEGRGSSASGRLLQNLRFPLSPLRLKDGAEVIK